MKRVQILLRLSPEIRPQHSLRPFQGFGMRRLSRPKPYRNHLPRIPLQIA